MYNFPNCSGNHSYDGGSDDDDDYDILLKHLKKKPPNKEAVHVSSHTNNIQGIAMNGLRCILYGELINGPFILFPSAQNSHINMICIYNEYFVENKMHHINLLDLNCILIHKVKSILMVLMATEVYEKVVHHRDDISESLNAGVSHVLEFLIGNEHDRETMVEDIKSLSINICRVCHYSDRTDASLKHSLYERLCPEVFLIWREVRTTDFSDATTNIDLISRMHVYLRDKVHSTFDEMKLFFYPIRGNIHLKSEKVLTGLNHIQSKQDIIAFDANNCKECVKGGILQRLMQGASLDDRLICFWFQW
jgi:hypothetical protein